MVGVGCCAAHLSDAIRERLTTHKRENLSATIEVQSEVIPIGRSPYRCDWCNAPAEFDVVVTVYPDREPLGTFKAAMRHLAQNCPTCRERYKELKQEEQDTRAIKIPPSGPWPPETE